MWAFDLGRGILDWLGLSLEARSRKLIDVFTEVIRHTAKLDF